MKQAIFILLFVVQGMIQEAVSQTSKSLVPDNVKLLNPGNGYLNSVNVRAIRDFVCKYEKATDVVWYNVDNGFIVRFTTDGTSARAAYRKNGHWVYTIKQYMETKMPFQVRHLVKSTYYDYSISLVEEIEQPDEPVKYIVHIQDNVSWKNILVSNGQMDLIEDKKKL